MWGILNHRLLRRFRFKSVKCYAKHFWMVRAEQVDSVMFSSMNLWLYLWCPRPCRLVMAKVPWPEIDGRVQSALLSSEEIMRATMSSLAIYHQVTSGEGWRLVCKVKKFCNAILRWWFISEQGAARGRGRDWAVLCPLPCARLLLTLHSCCWPDSHKALKWWPRGKNHSSLAHREIHFFN